MQTQDRTVDDTSGVVRTLPARADASGSIVALASPMVPRGLEGYDAQPYDVPARLEAGGAADRPGSPRPAAPPLCPTMEDFLAYLELRGRLGTARVMRESLRNLSRYLARHGITPLLATADQLQGYREYIVTEHRTPTGRPLMRSTQSRFLSQVVSYYQWLEARGIIVTRPARSLSIYVRKSRVVVRQHLTQQEATALLQTQARMVMALREGSRRWTIQVRNLAMLAVALATGRRASGVIHLHPEHLNLDRRELRIDREKGQTGRILPVAGWAIEVLRLYCERARPLLVKEPIPNLFIGLRGGPCTRALLACVIATVTTRTVAENPDLQELPGKHITWQSLRVSFATLLFANGCAIRSVNELMLHRSLSSTARYTPIPVEDLRQVCRTAHPRA